jgi:hypothetical protein
MATFHKSLSANRAYTLWVETFGPERVTAATRCVLSEWKQDWYLCKISGFHGGDYDECRLLLYKIPVRTSQETYYVSATEPSRLRLCKI